MSMKYSQILYLSNVFGDVYPSVFDRICWFPRYTRYMVIPVHYRIIHDIHFRRQNGRGRLAQQAWRTRGAVPCKYRSCVSRCVWLYLSVHDPCGCIWTAFHLYLDVFGSRGGVYLKCVSVVSHCISMRFALYVRGVWERLSVLWCISQLDVWGLDINAQS